MYKRDLLPLDGSPLAEVASISARTLADVFDALRMAAPVKEFSFSNYTAQNIRLEAAGMYTNDLTREGKIADAIMDVENTLTDAIAGSVDGQPDIQGWGRGPIAPSSAEPPV